MKSRIISVLSLSILLLFVGPKSHANLINLGVDFGVAQQYTMAAGSRTSSISLGSDAEIFGSVGANWYLGLASGAKIHGNACSDYISVGAGASIDGSKGQCGLLENDILQANLQATSLVNSAKSLGLIDQTTALNANDENNYLIDSLLLDSGEYLTISGRSSDEVVINIIGDAKIGSGGGILLTGGLTSANVLFNFVSKDFGFSEFNFGGADISGTFLADKGAFILGDGATLDDVRFYTNHSISANVQVVRTEQSRLPDTDLNVKVPEPETFALLLAGLFFLLMRTHSKHA